MNKIKSIDRFVLSLFSSAGIGELGLKASGLKILLSNELLQNRCALLLYDSKKTKEYQVFELDLSNHIIATNELMKSKGYPDLKHDREYLLYMITEEAGVKPYFDIESLR